MKVALIQPFVCNNTNAVLVTQTVLAGQVSGLASMMITKYKSVQLYYLTKGFVWEEESWTGSISGFNTSFMYQCGVYSSIIQQIMARVSTNTITCTRISFHWYVNKNRLWCVFQRTDAYWPRRPQTKVCLVRNRLNHHAQCLIASSTLVQPMLTLPSNRLREHHSVTVATVSAQLLLESNVSPSR